MDKGQSAPAARADKLRQEQAARDTAAQKATPQMNGTIPTSQSGSTQFTDWASI